MVDHPGWVLVSLERARNLLSQGADALLAGDIERARDLVSAADDPRLSEWFHKHIQVPSVLYPSLGLDHKSFASPPGNEVSRSVGSATLREVWARDKCQCRYCGIPVLLQRARDRLRREAGLRWGRSNLARHGCMVMQASHDHVLAHAWGGTNDIENLVTACWPCQFAKGAYRIEDLGLADPRATAPGSSDWDGLARLLAK